MEENRTTNRVKIEVIENGPLKITGMFKLQDKSREIDEEKNEVFLCRCSGSQSMPFCDGTHKRK